jgi:hypothetical protein
VFAGGFFREAAGSSDTFETRDTVARFDPDTGAMSAWQVPPGVIPNGVHATDLAATCEGLYVGFAGVNFDGQVDPWHPSFAGTFWGPWDILSTGDQVYVVGDFLTVSDVSQRYVARFTDAP